MSKNPDCYLTATVKEGLSLQDIKTIRKLSVLEYNYYSKSRFRKANVNILDCRKQKDPFSKVFLDPPRIKSQTLVIYLGKILSSVDVRESLRAFLFDFIDKNWEFKDSLENIKIRFF